MSDVHFNGGDSGGWHGLDGRPDGFRRREISSQEYRERMRSFDSQSARDLIVKSNETEKEQS